MFSDITADHIPTVEEIVRKSNQFASQYSYYNLFFLRIKYGTQICIKDDVLYIRQPNRDMNNYLSYLFPIGASSIEDALKNIYEHARQSDKYPLFWGITEEMLQILNDVFPNAFHAEEVRDWADYLYDSSSLIKTMKRANKFERVNAGKYEYEQINETNLSEVIDFQNWWLKENLAGNGDSKSLLLEHEAIIEALSLRNKIPIYGSCLRIEKEIKSYCLCIAQTDSFMILHVLKADKSYKGLYHYMIKQGILKLERPYINLEEDIGIEGLRTFKMLLKPSQILTKYIVHLKGGDILE